MCDWLPMKKAPKKQQDIEDFILLWVPRPSDAKSGRMYIGAWLEDGWWAFTIDGLKKVKPTRWQRLPCSP